MKEGEIKEMKGKIIKEQEREEKKRKGEKRIQQLCPSGEIDCYRLDPGQLRIRYENVWVI